MEAKGGTLVKVAGIIMIAGGALNIILSIVLIAGGALLAALGGGGGFVVAGIFSILVSIFELIVGIIATKNARDVDKASKLMGLAIIVAGLQLVSTILLGAVAHSGAGNIIVNIIFGIAVPVLMFIGAMKNKQGA